MFILVSQPHWQTKHNANEGQDEIMHHTCTAHNSASECTRSLDYFSSQHKCIHTVHTHTHTRVCVCITSTRKEIMYILYMLRSESSVSLAGFILKRCRSNHL